MNDSKKAAILIVFAVAMLAVTLTLLYQRQRTIIAPDEPPVVAATTAAWPVFRGCRQLTGYVKSMPEKPVVAWCFRGAATVNAGPVVSGSGIYFGDAEGNFYCLNLNTGKPVWKKKITDGISASALLVAGVCYIGSQSGEFFALSMADGKIVWRYKSEGQISGSANFFIDEEKLRIIFGGYDFKLHCLDAETGKELWNVSTGNYINGAPAVNGDDIVFGGCDGYLRTVDAVSGKEESKIRLKSYIPASPVIYDSVIYVASYGQKVFAFKQDGEALWSYDPGKNAAPFLSSPAVNDNVVVIGDRDGLVHVLNRKDGKQLTKFQASGDIAVPPVISDKYALVADKAGFIYIFDLKTGKETWRYQIGPEISAPVAVCGNKIIVADNDGNITVFNGTK